MELIGEILQYKFLSNALLAALLAGVACGLIGTYIVCRRLVFLSGGITHASFGGIGLAYYFGFNPLWGAFAFSLLAALGVETLTQKGKIREDSVIGMLWSLGMAIGIIFVYLTPGYAPNLMTFLFGNVLSVTKSDLWAIAALDVVLIAIYALFYRQIMFISFDREFAATQKVPVTMVNCVMMMLAAATIVLSIRVVGIVLLISLLTIPVASVNSFTKNYNRLSIGSCAVATFGTISGLLFSYSTDIPSGAATIFVLALILIVSKVVARIIKNR
ncbi:MAG: metal ABC transporter permease [Rikenellaceae bacterium]|nr:metal ABC transporter permease [Rikenellaceae bacterium]MBO5874596.1 metal ABC transporter permease [Rikenellaceae bacterium]MBO7213720.1 metal ABC transporter permease [Rikenellaceae bacterium]